MELLVLLVDGLLKANGAEGVLEVFWAGVVVLELLPKEKSGGLAGVESA